MNRWKIRVINSRKYTSHWKIIKRVEFEVVLSFKVVLLSDKLNFRLRFWRPERLTTVEMKPVILKQTPQIKTLNEFSQKHKRTQTRLSQQLVKTPSLENTNEAREAAGRRFTHLCFCTTEMMLASYGRCVFLARPN